MQSRLDTVKGCVCVCVISSSIGVTSNDDECMTGQAMCVASRSFFFFLFFFAVVRLSYTR